MDARPIIRSSDLAERVEVLDEREELNGVAALAFANRRPFVRRVLHVAILRGGRGRVSQLCTLFLLLIIRAQRTRLL